jgi:sulfate transport system substrate-binding protein
MSLEPATVTPTELQRLLAANPGLTLLDVRTPEEFLEAHIPQARNEPLDELKPEALLSRGVLAPGEPVYLVCRTDNRATKAAEKFAAAGQASTVVVRGGTLGWIAAGLPVLRSSLMVAILFLSLSLRLLAQDRLLNASFDVSRELFQQINPAFAAQWKADTGREIQIRQSHVGSSQQARAVADGLAADVVTLNQISDVELLAKQHLVAADWRSRLPFGAAPYSSISVFVVNPGNPKQIHDWDDLVRPGVRVSLVNPKTSGNGRYTFLAAWAFGLRKFGGDAGRTRDFVAELYRHVPSLAQGGRAATTIFAERGLADVLVTFESEAHVLRAAVTGKNFEVIDPSVTLRVEFPVAVVDRVVDRDGERPAAEAYLRFLYSPAGQKIILDNGFRPRTGSAAAPGPEAAAILDVDAVFGGWEKAQAQFFADGAIFDQIIEKTY